MDPLKPILDRRSIRKFTGQPIEKEVIDELLNAAMYAPSAVNCQPWHFVVIDDRNILDQVMEIHPHASMLSTASHAVVVCGDEELQHDAGYWVADCGAATQNLLLAAHIQGVGSCWVGLYPREKRQDSISGLLGLPAPVRPFALVALGYPAENKSRPDRFRKERVKRNHWSEPYYRS